MSAHKIGDGLAVLIDDSYEKKPFPGLNKWVEALRSGKYDQGWGRLEHKDAYCCLGVLCAIQGRPSRVGQNGNTVYDVSAKVLSAANPVTEILSVDGTLPDAVTVMVPGIDSVFKSSALTYLNDSGVSFNDIAELLELVWFDPEKTA